MTDLFYMGGPLFMGVLTIILIVLISTAAFGFIRMNKNKSNPILTVLVKEIGLFAFVVGIFGQFIGLYNAFTVISESGSISPQLLVGGLKVSSITTLYGLLICIVGYVLYFSLRLFHVSGDQAQG